MYFSFALFLNFASLADKTITPPHFVIDLDKEPNERWTHVAEEYKYIAPELHKFVSGIVPKNLIPLVEQIAADIDTYLPPPYGQEISGIAKAIGVNLGDMVILNLIYEIESFCTSIVAQDRQGNIWHARNLDFIPTNVLRNITISLDFQRSGKTVYTATSYAGYVGLLTAMKPHEFSLTLNQRNKGSWLENVLVAILDRTAVPAGFLTRDALENCDKFEDAVRMLSKTDTIADVYFILAGTRKQEGVVITKDRIGSDDIWYINTTQNRWFLVETNYEHWLPPPPDDDRRDPAIEEMGKMGQNNINVENLFHVLSTPPVLNSHTTYTTVMSPNFPEKTKTWIRHS